MIVLEILKIIGIVLACIVGLVILLVLAVLLIPIGYQITAKGENADLEASGSVQWMAGFVKAVVEYKEKKVSYRVSIAFIKLLKGVIGEDETEVLRQALQEEPAVSDLKEYTKVSKELEKAEEKKEKSEASKELKKTEKEAEKEAKKEEKQAEKDAKKAEKEAEKEAKKAEQEALKEAEKEMTLKERVDVRVQKVKDLIERLKAVSEKVNAFNERLQEGKRLLESKITQRALKHVKVELLHILNHIKPRKIAGTLGFGVEDPATTAILYGNAAWLAEVISKGKLLLIPQFYKSGIQADLIIKGRIFLGYMVLCGIRLLLDRDLHRVVKAVRRYMNG